LHVLHCFACKGLQHTVCDFFMFWGQERSSFPAVTS
jgi:hypothetical protein